MDDSKVDGAFFDVLSEGVALLADTLGVEGENFEEFLLMLSRSWQGVGLLRRNGTYSLALQDGFEVMMWLIRREESLLGVQKSIRVFPFHCSIRLILRAVFLDGSDFLMISLAVLMLVAPVFHTQRR